MPLACLTATIDDGLDLGCTYIDAFIGDPFHDTAIQDVPFARQVAGFVKRYPRHYAVADIQYRKVEDLDTGEVLSYAKWKVENAEEDLFPQLLEDIPEHIKCDKSPIPDPEGLNVSFVQNFSEKVYKFRRQLEGKPYLRLLMLGTSKSAQRRGAGTLQVLWGVEFANQHGLPLWAEATRNSVRILKRLGFEELGQIVVHPDRRAGGGEYTFHMLLKQPKSKPE